MVVVNARHAALTGRKAADKEYFWHSGWPGGDKTLTYAEYLARDPTGVGPLAFLWCCCCRVSLTPARLLPHRCMPFKYPHKHRQPLKRAVYGMLPKNKLRPLHMERLHLFPDELPAGHPYAANALRSHLPRDPETGAEVDAPLVRLRDAPAAAVPAAAAASKS